MLSPKNKYVPVKSEPVFPPGFPPESPPPLLGAVIVILNILLILLSPSAVTTFIATL